MNNILDRRSFLALSSVAVGAFLGGCGTSNTSGQGGQAVLAEPAVDASEPIGLHHATMVVKDFGTIKLELYGDQAPITVENFMNLVNDGFYNGLTFHRVIDGFVIQGGDPLGNGTGGSSQTIKGEFYANGVTNVIPHQRGVISMARSSEYDSASSQFFIVHQDAMESLDGKYAAFGRVTEGMDVVDAIATTTPVQDNNGTVAPDDQPVIESVVIDD